MLSGIKLAKFIKGATEEEEAILKKVKKLVEKKQYSVNARPVKKAKYPETTPLIEAVRQGLQSVIEYLLSKGAMIDAVVLGDQTALDLAIIFEQSEAAELLIEKGADLIHRGSQSGNTPLHLAAARSLPDVVTSLVRKLPPEELNAQSTHLATPLHLSVLGNQPENAKILLRAGADGTLRDIQDVDPFVFALSVKTPEVAKIILENGYCLKPQLSMQGLLQSPLEIVQKNIRAKSKIPFYNLLLYAGAGLDINNIPETILKKYNPLNRPMGPFLLLGTKQLADMAKPKFVVISNLESLEICLKNPDVKINTTQLALSIQAFENENLEYIERIKALLPEEELVDAQEQYSKIQQREEECDLKQPTLNSIRKDEFSRTKKVPREHWKKEYAVSKGRLDYTSEAIQALLLGILLELKQSDKTITLSNLANRQVMAVLNAAVEHIHLAGSTIPKWQAQIFHDCSQGIDKIYKCMLSIANELEDLQCFDGNVINMQVFESFIKDIFSHFRIVLRQQHVNDFNAFVDARVGALLYMARAYIKQGNIDVALTLAHKAMRENTSLVLNNEKLKIKSKDYKARAKKVFVDIYLLQGWNKKAAHLFLEVIDCYGHSNILDNGLVETSRNLLEKDLNPRLRLKVLSALKQYNDGIKNNQRIRMQPNKHALLKSLISEIVLPMIDELKISIFDLDVSLVSKELDRYGDIVVNSGDFSLVLTVPRFKNRKDTIKFAISKKYVFLDVITSDKTFTFNLKGIVKAQMEVCLDEIKNLLEPQVKVVEPIIVLREKTNLPEKLAELLISSKQPEYYPAQCEPYHPPQIREKIKTKGVPGAEYLEVEREDDLSVFTPSYGFDVMEGYGPIIPITLRDPHEFHRDS